MSPCAHRRARPAIPRPRRGHEGVQAVEAGIRTGPRATHRSCARANADGNSLVALDETTVHKIWSFPPRSGVGFNASPAAANGLVCIGCQDKDIHAIKAWHYLGVRGFKRLAGTRPLLRQ